MADGIESLNVAKNTARVQAGWKGGNCFQKLLTAQPMTIIEGYPSTVVEKFGTERVSMGTVLDPWNQRRK